MSTKHSGFPVGSTGESVAKNGAIAKYWLKSRSQRQGSISQFYEVWYWGISYEDSSGGDFDWGTTRKMVLDEVEYKKLRVCSDTKKWPRFKRVE